MKECSCCHELKPLSEFHYQNKAEGKRCAMCRSCKNAKARSEYWAHPEASRKAEQIYRLKNLDAIRARKRAQYWDNVEEERAKARERARKAREAESELPPEERERARSIRAAKQHQYYIRRKARLLRGDCL
jgi:hypothetical protein